MAPVDERLKSLNIVLPDVMPPVVDGYVPAFAPFTRSGDQIHLSGRLGKEGWLQAKSAGYHGSAANAPEPPSPQPYPGTFMAHPS
jgi:hypothetical protein